MLHYVRVLGEPGNRRFDVAGAVRSFLITRGFREERGGDSGMRFRRSSQLATLFAFDPSRWRIDIQIDPLERSAKMSVFTDGQVVTPRERKYFQVFFDEVLAVMSPETSARSNLTIWGEQAMSRRAARAALNENVGVMFGFFLSFPLLTLLLNAAVGLPMLWAIGWAFGGSLAIAYACLFSVKNRQKSDQSEPQVPADRSRNRLPSGST